MRGWIATADSPLGTLRLAATGRGLCALGFAEEDVPGELRRRFPEVQWGGDDAGRLGPWRAALDAYFSGRPAPFDGPLDLRGTPFQLAVWRALLRIPHGETRTYGEVARAIGRPGAVRAVGAACGANPVGIVVPCHRVVGAGGRLTGYAGGLHRKALLLALEGVAVGRGPRPGPGVPPAARDPAARGR